MGTRILDSLHECATKQICRSSMMLSTLYGPGSLMNVLSTSLNPCLNDFKLFWGLSECWSVNSCCESHLLVQQINATSHMSTVRSYTHKTDCVCHFVDNTNACLRVNLFHSLLTCVDRGLNSSRVLALGC